MHLIKIYQSLTMPFTVKVACAAKTLLRGMSSPGVGSPKYSLDEKRRAGVDWAIIPGNLPMRESMRLFDFPIMALHSVLKA
jgi:hypothetical protein